MSAATATVQIQTRKWVGRTGIVRYYITNLAEVTGRQAGGQRHISAWINEDGSWDYNGFNNSDWAAAIDAAVKAHNQAEATVATCPDVPGTVPAAWSSEQDVALHEWLTLVMDSEDGI